MKPPNAILFDIDGTLIDSYRLYLESYRRALAPFIGRTPSLEEIAARRPGSERRFLEQWVSANELDACHADMCRHYEALHATLCEGMYDGVREMLGGLRSAGLPLGVVTGKGRTAWNVTVANLELGPFEAIVTEEDVEHPKPHPAGLLAASDAMGVEPAAVVYIGDSAGDMEAARLAGMFAGAALWPKTGPGEKEDFLAHISPFTPDWTFDRPADVVRAFAPWC